MKKRNASRQELINLLFKDAISILEKKVKYIRKKKKLINADKHHELVCGLLIPGDDGAINNNVIYLNSSKTHHKDDYELAKTLFHEVLHIIMPHCCEQRILKYENLCWKYFTDEQKEILKSYLPKKEVKLNP